MLTRATGILVILGVLVASACAPTAAPGPTVAPSKAVETPRQGVSTTSASPKEGTGSTGSSAAKSDWQAEWDRTLAAAKKEGKVVVAGAPGDAYRIAATAFQKAYPDIQLEYTGVQGSNFGARIQSERDGGQFIWDVHLGGGDTALSLKNAGIFDPLKPVVLLPDALDNSKWHGGFDDGFLDKERQYVYQFMGYVNYLAYVNREVAPESELSKVEQLLDPKWKGKIATFDPRNAGSSNAFMGQLFLVNGEDWLRKFYSQNLIVQNDLRPLIEGLIRGSYPVAIGIAAADMAQFKREGLAGNVKPLDPDSQTGSRLTGGFGNVILINKAPHPNAAKVFINWLLSQEGEKAYVDATNLNSRRLNAGGPPETAANPNVKYLDIHKEENAHNTLRARDIAREMIK